MPDSRVCEKVRGVRDEKSTTMMISNSWRTSATVCKCTLPQQDEEHGVTHPKCYESKQQGMKLHPFIPPRMPHSAAHACCSVQAQFAAAYWHAVGRSPHLHENAAAPAPAIDLVLCLVSALVMSGFALPAARSRDRVAQHRGPLLSGWENGQFLPGCVLAREREAHPIYRSPFREPPTNKPILRNQ